MGISELKKKENYHQILQIQINPDSKFQFQHIIPKKTSQKKYSSGRKQKKMSISTEFFIFELV